MANPIVAFWSRSGNPIVDLLAIEELDRRFTGDRIENRRPADRRVAVRGNSGGF
ncbi:hypothetical protein [Mesorhizobium sp.]|uniref:hypothetical protein n=1 Tax=Mesorhizobium sp. TaxID=1871066 RepID=UPI0025EF1DAB|nr:hypothetical protein [Mesorhizobium sp.]